MCSNVYDDITDFEVCEFTKNSKSKYLKKETFCVQIKKSDIKGCKMAQNSFLDNVTFNQWRNSLVFLRRFKKEGFLTGFYAKYYWKEVRFWFASNSSSFLAAENE